MKLIKILLFFISLTIITACEKDEENINIKVELISSESIEIINSEFDVQVYGYDPNFQDVPATLITHKKFNSTQIPFILKIEIPENAADIIEYINDKNDAKYYLNIDWDSDGNGKICNGDISIDFNASYPDIFINKTETQTINIMTINSILCE